MSVDALVAPVRWVGAQRDVLAGGIGGLVDLRTLAGRPHLYALGPLEGCRGEVSVFDGVPSIARVVDGQAAVESGLSVGILFDIAESIRIDTGDTPGDTSTDIGDLYQRHQDSCGE